MNNIKFDFDGVSVTKTIPFVFNNKEGIVIISQISVGGFPVKDIIIESDFEFTENEKNLVIEALRNKLSE